MKQYEYDKKSGRILVTEKPTAAAAWTVHWTSEDGMRPCLMDFTNANKGTYIQNYTKGDNDESGGGL